MNEGERHGVSPSLYDECLYISYDHRGSSTIDKRMTSSDLLEPTPPSSSLDINLLRRGSPSRVSLFEEGRAARWPPVMELDTNPSTTPTTQPLLPKWMGKNEVFVFDFGVLVLWNFSEEEELSYISTLRPFATNPRLPEDFLTEDFHFQYDLVRKGSSQPRIFNDMITLKSGNPMIKLTISQYVFLFFYISIVLIICFCSGVAQSAKLALFENEMEAEIVDTTTLPKMMAKYGEVSISQFLQLIHSLYSLYFSIYPKLLIETDIKCYRSSWTMMRLSKLWAGSSGYA
jgi:uncharacterized Rmd1/YagE family protein